MSDSDYLSRLRAKNLENERSGGTAQTAKTHLHGLCSSPPVRRGHLSLAPETPRAATSGASLAHPAEIQSPSPAPNGTDLPTELISLIHAAADWYGCPADERALMLEAARHDVPAAWSTFGALAQERAQDASHAVPNELVTCELCSNLSGRGRCLAAVRGEIDAAKTYSPVPNLPRRCKRYSMKTGGLDRRFVRSMPSEMNEIGGFSAEAMTP